MTKGKLLTEYFSKEGVINNSGGKKSKVLSSGSNSNNIET